MRPKDKLQIWLKTSLEDPISKTLAHNSHLSPTQLETLLIELSAENLTGKPLTFDEKASFRLLKAEISRGSFNRTLKQAEDNVRKSIYTVLLLGYLGVFESTELDPFIEISNKLRKYLDTCRALTLNHSQSEDQAKTMETIRKELDNTLKALTTPSHRRM